MDMRIYGKGNIPAGNYDKVVVRGKGFLYGKINCLTFSSSGGIKGESIECKEHFKTSGRALFLDNIMAKNVRVSGFFSCDGDVVVKERFSCSGTTKCKKNIKCDDLAIFGSLHVGDGIESENVNISGVLKCDRLVNANNVRIIADRLISIGSISGCNIVLKRKKFSVVLSRRINVLNAIEGDNLFLEYVTCPSVIGRVVNIGKGCKIDVVRYKEEINISTKAVVGKIEKI